MKKKLVVIGYGGMGGWHTRNALTSDVVELAGTFDIKESRQQAARDNGIYAYDSFEAVLNDPTVDLLTIAVPNDVHEELVIKALEAGKNVICEKPATIGSASLKRMIEASERTGKMFTVHQNRRWDVDYLAMQKLVDSGEIGQIVNIESRVHGSRGIPSDWRGQKEYGGGMLYDWGIHLIDQMLLLFGDKKIKSLFCTFDNITNKEVDDGFKLHLYFEGGGEGYIEVGTLNFLSMPRFYMRGLSGSALITDWTQKTKVVHCKAWHESDVLPVQTAAGLTKTMAPRDEITTDTYELERPASDVHDYYRNVCAAIDGKATQIVTHEQMMRDMLVTEAAFESVEKGQVIVFEQPL
ncbi:MAG: Gfo/Idh/MocA family oxidoreductase [Clostridia bacterium]|nr:Gfo/Idh/MocA family oxidoreductase [Clostridia bacterium]